MYSSVMGVLVGSVLPLGAAGRCKTFLLAAAPSLVLALGLGVLAVGVNGVSVIPSVAAGGAMTLAASSLTRAP